VDRGEDVFLMWNWWPWVSAPAWANALRTELLKNQEVIVSDLSGMTAALADLKNEIGNIGSRMDANFAALLAAQAAGNQPAIDAATAEIRGDIDALKAIETRDTPATPPAP
jgi:hypothetical protein